MKHYVTGRELFKSYPESVKEIILGAGCFWGVERLFWELPGVWTTYVSYSGGRRDNPTYEEVCMGVTGHVETVNVFYDQKQIKFETILKTFWECHDPTQGMRQGNDIGEQYRSVIFCKDSYLCKKLLIYIAPQYHYLVSSLVLDHDIPKRF